jgi:PAS domain S-box-containing protein
LASDKYVYASEECCRIFEFDPQEGLPTREAFARQIHPEDYDKVHGEYEKSLREKVDTSIEFRIALPSGAAKHIQAIQHPVLNEAGDVVQLVGTTIDITERKRDEESLRESEANLNRAQEIAHIGSWHLDLPGNSLTWSDEVYRIFGMPRGAPLSYGAFLNRVHPEDREGVDRAWTAALRGAAYDIEHRILVGDEVKWVREKAGVEFDQQGKAIKGIGTVQDITERRLAEARVQEHAAELQASNQALRESEENTRRAFEEIERLKAQLEQQNAYLREEVVEAKAFGDLVGQSAALQQVVSQIDLVAPTDAAVLIQGETGTGKELVAHEIHRRSHRRDKPLVRVNCASVPRDLYESEFFGHAKGAFTGAIKERAGRFETAEGGTLFLDEIAEVPLELQGKLLRVLQEKRYERVGEDRTRQADVRIIAATNRDLKREVEARRFREDLYYRLNVFPIRVAPLRERKDDIPLLAQHFVQWSVTELRCPKARLARKHPRTPQRY